MFWSSHLQKAYFSECFGQVVDELRWFLISKKGYLLCRKRILRLRWQDLWIIINYDGDFSSSRYLSIPEYLRLERKMLQLWLKFNYLTQALCLNKGLRSVIEYCIICSSPYFLTVISGQTSFIESKVIRIYWLAGVTRMHDVSWPSIIPSYHSWCNVQPCWP